MAIMGHGDEVVRRAGTEIWFETFVKNTDKSYFRFFAKYRLHKFKLQLSAS